MGSPAEEETTDAQSQSTPESFKPKISSRDAKLHFLMGRYNADGDFESYQDLAQEIRHRMALDTTFYNLFPDIYEVDGTFIDPLKERMQPHDFDCLRFLIETYETKCMPFNEYGMGHIKYLVEYCETQSTAEILHKARDMANLCLNLTI